MKGYVIKHIVKATDDNPNFKGETKEYILIKGGFVRYTNEPIFQYMTYASKGIAERVARGYAKKDAERLFKTYWTDEYQVEEVDV